MGALETEGTVCTGMEIWRNVVFVGSSKSGIFLEHHVRESRGGAGIGNNRV